MSSESVLPYTGKGAGCLTLAAIIGGWSALQCLLPSVAFASPYGQHIALSSDDDKSNLQPVPLAVANLPPKNVSHQGATLVANIYCPRCGQQVRADTIDCPVCHYRFANEFQARVISSPETENKSVSQDTPPGPNQGSGMGEGAGGVAIEAKLRNLWNRVGQ